MSVLVLNTLSEYNDEILELQNLICEKSEGSEVVYTKDMKKVVMCPSGRRDAVTIPDGVEEIAKISQETGITTTEVCGAKSFVTKLLNKIRGIGEK